MLDEARKIAEIHIKACGANLYDIEFSGNVLRIFVDKDDGIAIDDIGELSEMISASFDQNEIMGDQKYLLEVSSPGLDRKLRTQSHFEAQIGSRITVKTKTRIDDMGRFEGVLVGVSDDAIQLETASAKADEKAKNKTKIEDKKMMTIPLGNLDTARVVVDWQTELGGSRR